MALTTPAYIYDTMRNQNYGNWRVYCDGSLVNKYEQTKTETADLEMAISQLKKCIESQIGGLLEITISSKTGAEKLGAGKTENHTLKFYCEAAKANPIGNIEMTSDLNELKNLYQELAEKKYRIQELEKENEKLKQDAASYEDEEYFEDEANGIGAILDEVRPYIKPLINKFLGTTLPLEKPAPINDNVSEEATDKNTKATAEQIDQIKKCSAGALRILKHDHYFGERVLQLAILVEKDKASYDMACNMLNTMAQKLQ